MCKTRHFCSIWKEWGIFFKNLDLFTAYILVIKWTKLPPVNALFFRKKKVVRFFLKKNIPFFFSEFSKRCLKNSSKGTKNNELKILSGFRDIWEIFVKMYFFAKKKSCSKFFEIRIFRFFSRNFPKDVPMLFLRGRKTINWKCWVVFEILEKFL